MRRVARGEGQLLEWGGWYRRTHEATAGSHNLLFRIAIMGIPGTGEPGHKILCPDFPPRVQKTHRAVIRLEDFYKQPLVLYYASPLKEDGTPYTMREIAEIVGISKEGLRSRIRRGRKQVADYLNLPP